METKTLELKDIVGYLAYGLHCLNCDNMIEEIEFDNVGNLIRGIDLQDEAEYDDWVACQQYKPILRPLSDLYKTITHNGKEIVPIVELAKMHRPEYKWFFDETCACCEREKFNYFNGFNAGSFNGKVCNQHQLFDYLHELKIDYRGLIDAGLAVDVNTLEINPYK